MGRLERHARLVQHPAIEGVEEVWHWETVAEYPNGGKDVAKVIDIEGIEAQGAWEEEVPYLTYIPYTQEELEAMELEKNRPTEAERIAALEEENTYLKETLEILLSRATQEETDG
ncbi:MAG: hypothetical protein IJ461_05860 [Clostridia bacterium]|nr:hypothetical protein [Clostridia bacterium]